VAGSTTGISGQACSFCGAGKYKGALGSMECTNCHPHSNTTVVRSSALSGSIDVTACLCDLFHDGPSGGPCEIEKCLVGETLAPVESHGCDAYSTCCPGQVVRRGVDWKWKDQDDGSELMELSRGHLSTRLAPKLPGGAT